MGRLNYDQSPAQYVPTAAAGDSSSAVASTAFVQNAVPAGVVLPYAGPLPPEGWMLCDGSAVSRTTYAKLFAAIGTTYGAGNGTTTFNLPEARGEFIRGLDQGRGVDSGRALGTAQQDALQNITGTIQPRPLAGAGGGAIGGATGAGAFDLSIKGGAPGASSITTGTAANTDVLTFDASRVARTAAETRPRNVAMNYIIKFA
ncbi:putative tail-collar fiber protein [Bordetella phage vB_BbrM_PHB04]|uniref:Putative tail-collar fiber protein n=1 Tax=Bordetella phage vB_BbrM_PHB04 TaxID=2029657 RepID=A0A291LA10_9CAUD|nr:tail collar fiber protein [Bordetella phage vB_BbrM_PHB04]ATI15740.1 putative tail-collar fiber protein [Bordetella phage vB_BbrM_PHB04]